MNNTKTLSINDQIFATLIVGGKVVLNLCRSNFASINDVVRFICSNAGRFMGLAQLNIRNKTQGWSVNMAIASQPTTSRPALRTAQPAQYRQASLFNY